MVDSITKTVLLTFENFNNFREQISHWHDVKLISERGEEISRFNVTRDRIDHSIFFLFSCIGWNCQQFLIVDTVTHTLYEFETSSNKNCCFHATSCRIVEQTNSSPKQAYSELVEAVKIRFHFPAKSSIVWFYCTTVHMWIRRW